MVAAARAPPQMVVVVVVQRKEVELRIVFEIERETRHVRKERPGTVARRAVLEDAVETVKVHDILTPDGKIDKSVKKALGLDEQIVKKQLVGECARTGVRLHVPAKFVGKTRIDAQILPEFNLSPHARAKAHSVDVASVGRRALQPSAGKPHDVVIELLANAQIGARIKSHFSKSDGGAKRRRQHQKRFSHFTGRSFSCPSM